METPQVSEAIGETPQICEFKLPAKIRLIQTGQLTYSIGFMSDNLPSAIALVFQWLSPHYGNSNVGLVCKVGLVRKEADLAGREAFRASKEMSLTRRRKGLGVSLSLSHPSKIWRQSYP